MRHAHRRQRAVLELSVPAAALPRGLANMAGSKSCYMNALLQCLYNDQILQAELSRLSELVRAPLLQIDLARDQSTLPGHPVSVSSCQLSWYNCFIISGWC